MQILASCFVLLSLLELISRLNGHQLYNGQSPLNHGLIGRFRNGLRSDTTLPTAPEQWFTQKLDHFDPSEHRTWKQVCTVINLWN